MSITSLSRLYFRSRQKQLQKHFTEPELLQQHVLEHLLSRAIDTKYGLDHAFSAINTYEDFCQNVPVTPTRN